MSATLLLQESITDGENGLAISRRTKGAVPSFSVARYQHSTNAISHERTRTKAEPRSATVSRVWLRLNPNLSIDERGNASCSSVVSLTPSSSG